MSGGDSTERGARGVRSLAPWGVVCGKGGGVRNEELGPHTHYLLRILEFADLNECGSNGQRINPLYLYSNRIII